MASSDPGSRLNPAVAILNIQRIKIAECIRSLNDVIEDRGQSCSRISELLSQLEQLCQLHFMYEVQLLEEINYPSLSEQKMLFDLLLKHIESFKAKLGQCHTQSFHDDFIRLRLDFIFNMNNETGILCDYVTLGQFRHGALPH